jgi:hypothetical protein
MALRVEGSLVAYMVAIQQGVPANWATSRDGCTAEQRLGMGAGGVECGGGQEPIAGVAVM